MAVLSERDRETLSLFVDEMRAMREQRGWSQAELAENARYSESLIAMVETYRRAPTEALAKALDGAFGSPDTFARLQRKVRTVSFPAAFRPFAEHEAKATALRWFEHSLVPGLLQTEDYARAVLSTRPNSTELTHLADTSRRPNVTIQVVPYSAGGHSGLLGAFILADLPSPQSMVFIEDVSGGRVAEDAPAVCEVALRFDTLRSEALPKAASRDLIAKVAQEQWKA